MIIGGLPKIYVLLSLNYGSIFFQFHSNSFLHNSACMYVRDNTLMNIDIGANDANIDATN